jgi:hypothetical protein
LLQKTAWKTTVDRVKMYQRLLQTGNYTLHVPFGVTCYGDQFVVTGLAQ